MTAIADAEWKAVLLQLKTDLLWEVLKQVEILLKRGTPADDIVYVIQECKREIGPESICTTRRPPRKGIGGWQSLGGIGMTASAVAHKR